MQCSRKQKQKQKQQLRAPNTSAASGPRSGARTRCLGKQLGEKRNRRSKRDQWLLRGMNKIHKPSRRGSGKHSAQNPLQIVTTARGRAGCQSCTADFSELSRCVACSETTYRAIYEPAQRKQCVGGVQECAPQPHLPKSGEPLRLMLACAAIDEWR